VAQADEPGSVDRRGSRRGSGAASEYRALEAQVRELQRLLGKKAMENELLREAVSRAAGPKKLLLRSTSLPGDGL
jgi:transposase